MNRMIEQDGRNDTTALCKCQEAQAMKQGERIMQNTPGSGQINQATGSQQQDELREELQRQLEGAPSARRYILPRSYTGRNTGSASDTRTTGTSSLDELPDPMDEDDDEESVPESPESLPFFNNARSSLQNSHSLTPKPAWDYTLPKIIFSMPSINFNSGNNFDMTRLITTMQRGNSAQNVITFLESYDKATISSKINDDIEGFPSIFYAVSTNNPDIIRTWVSYGADINAVHAESGVPLLAYAIMLSNEIQKDTTLTVSTLLSLGALPTVIPSAFYTPFCRDLPEIGPAEQELLDIQDANNEWCNTPSVLMLAQTLLLSQRYFLEKALHTRAPTLHERQVAARKGAELLFGIPYFLIGQTTAADALKSKMMTHVTVNRRRPLVMAFAGPSGHGKTELARKLKTLLSLDTEVVGSSNFMDGRELFGARAPFAGSENGSPLNNLLREHDGKTCIVSLDEFERMSSQVRDTLLQPSDNGEYQDRRDGTRVDCSKTIWILATNAVDATIQQFCKTHHQKIFVDRDNGVVMKLMKVLAKELNEHFKVKFGVS